MRHVGVKAGAAMQVVESAYTSADYLAMPASGTGSSNVSR